MTTTIANSPKTRRQFHAIGRETYGKGWSAHRAAGVATLGLASSNQLTPAQAQAILDNRVRPAALSVDAINALLFD